MKKLPALLLACIALAFAPFVLYYVVEYYNPSYIDGTMKRRKI